MLEVWKVGEPVLVENWVFCWDGLMVNGPLSDAVGGEEFSGALWIVVERPLNVIHEETLKFVAVGC